MCDRALHRQYCEWLKAHHPDPEDPAGVPFSTTTFHNLLKSIVPGLGTAAGTTDADRGSAGGPGSVSAATASTTAETPMTPESSTASIVPEAEEDRDGVEAARSTAEQPPQPTPPAPAQPQPATMSAAKAVKKEPGDGVAGTDGERPFKLRQCKACGGTGHNVRTCPAAAVVKVVPGAVAFIDPLPGTVAVAPGAVAAAATLTSPAATGGSTTALGKRKPEDQGTGPDIKPRHCGLCGKPGHNTRTCWDRSPQAMLPP